MGTSKYKGVNWYKEQGKWCAQVSIKGRQKYGGMFKDELEAAKRVNQLCEELGIPPLNPTIRAIPNEQYQAKGKTSQYKGVHWHKENKKWVVKFHLNGQAQKYGGSFNKEMDAAKKVNQLCIELGISEKNPGINGMPNQQYQKREKTSQYKGVCWHKQRKIWRVQMRLKGGKLKFGGNFKDELDAAKRVNQLCEELVIPPQNPAVIEMPTQASPHDDFQTIENPVISVKILNTDDDDANKMKRKRKKEFNDDDKPPVERNYFYDYLLK